METLQTSTFTVELNQDSTSRAARRLIFNSDVLKAAKLYTGDVVILSNGDMTTSAVKKKNGFFFHAPFVDALSLIGQVCGGSGLAIA